MIPNGYDPEVFTGIAPAERRSTHMIVTHVGTVYKTASPRFYLDAVDSLPEEIRSRIETRFVGRVAESERPLMEGRQSKVTLLGFMPQAEALQYMADTDYLLLTMTNDISVPGKLFEYMAVRRPILAIAAPGSEVDRLLAETGAGMCAPPDSVERIRELLIAAFEGGGLANPAFREMGMQYAAMSGPASSRNTPDLCANRDALNLSRISER